jgi:hypothetical protein
VAKGADRKKGSFSLFAKPLDTLEFDVGRWLWPDNWALHSYTAKQGRHLIHPRQVLERTIPEK